MDWKVVNAVNRDVERQHLNKILKDISSRTTELTSGLSKITGDFGQQQQNLTSTVVRIINTQIGADKLVTSVTLTGDVTGTSTVVPGQNAVTINTSLAGAVLEDAPVDGNPYWRNSGQWQLVPPEQLWQEAPVDGNTYGRKDEDWVQIVVEPSPPLLPVVTGEILNSQPVFVYADDGSLIYTEV